MHLLKYLLSAYLEPAVRAFKKDTLQVPHTDQGYCSTDGNEQLAIGKMRGILPLHCKQAKRRSSVIVRY